MERSQLSLLSLALISAFSAAYADDETIAGRIPLSDDNHAQMAAENVRKINAAYFSGSLNNHQDSSPASQVQNDGNGFSGSLNIPADLQVKGYQPEINQSYDLQSNSNYVLPVSGSLNATDWQIDDSYALENGHYLDKVFQQDTDTVLLAENTVTDTATDANSGSLNNHQDSSPASQVQNDGNSVSGSLKEDNTPIKETANTANATELESITVIGERKIKSKADDYAQKINRTQIEHSASGNGDIGTALRVLPNVQFDDKSKTSLNQGEIKPEKVSISGAHHYQNKWTLDGLTFNNDLDPANESAYYQGRPPGRSQGLAIDTSLLESITVYDSNVSAEHGGFAGGVVAAETRRPEKDLGFKISHQYTNGNVSKGFPKSLSKYHIYGDENELDSFVNSWSSGKQPIFTKHITRLSGESIINDQWGVIGSFERTHSNIPLRLNSDDYKGVNYTAPTSASTADQGTAKQDQDRYQYNGFLKAYYDPTPDLGFELSYTYSPDWSKEYLLGSKGYFYEVEHGGHQLNFKTKYNNEYGKLTNTFGIQKLNDRVNAVGYRDWKYWMLSDSYNYGNASGWAVNYGGYPTSISNQFTISDKIMQEFKPIKWGNTEHTFKTGVEFNITRSDFRYGEKHYLGNGTTIPMTKEQQEKCIAGGDYSWCDPYPAYDVAALTNLGAIVAFNPDAMEQMDFIDRFGNQRNTYVWKYGQWRGGSGGTTFTNQRGATRNSTLWHYDDSKIKVHDNQFGLFFEDDIKWDFGENKGTLNIRPGIRWDYDSLMSKHTFAPRFFTNYDFAWGKTSPNWATGVSFGLNRYYGRNMYAYALEDGVYKTRTDIRRTGPEVKPEDVLAEGRECTDSKDWNNCVVKYQSETKFDKLKIPYDDEFTVGFTQQLKAFKLTGQYIRRNGRDQVTKTRSDYLGRPVLNGYDDVYYVFTNDGRSKSDIIKLKLENEKPLVWGKTKNTFGLALDWTNTKRNKADYSATLSTADLQDDYILWDGKAIRWSERPADNFVKPYTVKLTTHHEIDALGGKWFLNNLFNFKAGYHTSARKYDAANRRYETVAGKDYGIDQPTLDVYSVVKLPSTFQWDMRLGAEYAVYKKNKLFFNIDVMNVLNKRNTVLASLQARTGDLTPTYGIGRQFWFELGYKYY